MKIDFKKAEIKENIALDHKGGEDSKTFRRTAATQGLYGQNHTYIDYVMDGGQWELCNVMDNIGDAPTLD